MWYDVVSKNVMSSCMSSGISLTGGRDTLSHLSMTVHVPKNMEKHRCNERQKAKTDGSKSLTYTTGLCGLGGDFLFIIRDKTRVKDNTYTWVSV